MITSEEALRLAKKYAYELVGEKIANVIQMITDLSTLTKKRIVYYGVCDTAAATATKAVSIPEITEYYTGLHLRVKFTNDQNFEGTPTLKINSLNAKSIQRLSGTNAQRLEWQSGEVVDFVYDGTYFVIADGGRASTTHFGVTKLSSSTSSSDEWLAATPKAVKAAYDLADGKAPKDHASTATTYGKGTDTKYGHLKLSDSTSSASGTSDGVAATPSAVKAAYDLAVSNKVYEITTPSFSSLPVIFFNGNLTSDMKVVGNAVYLSNPKAGDIDWDITFGDMIMTISGTFHGNTATTATMNVSIPQEISVSPIIP